MRLFVSVDLPECATAVADRQRELAPASGISLTDPDQTHVTLKFLGEVDSDRLETLSETLDTAVAESSVDPFRVTLKNIGAFPSEEYIQVVWAGISDGATELERLHELIEDRLTARGFEPEDHEFTPHATIARMEHAGGKERVQRALGETEALASQEVQAVRLTKSELREEGPVYTTVHESQLG